MDWVEAMEDERRMLKSIVALLFFFAWLAGLSCALPRSARGYVLGVLYRAEARACEFVVGMAQDHGVAPPAFLLMPAFQGGDSRADAMRLARHFRALAVLLDSLVDRSLGRCGRFSPSASGLLAALSGMLADATGRQLRHAPMGLAFEPIDSS